jgi:hypothetical protein
VWVSLENMPNWGLLCEEELAVSSVRYRPEVYLTWSFCRQKFALNRYYSNLLLQQSNCRSRNSTLPLTQELIRNNALFRDVRTVVFVKFGWRGRKRGPCWACWTRLASSHPNISGQIHSVYGWTTRTRELTRRLRGKCLLLFNLIVRHVLSRCRPIRGMYVRALVSCVTIAMARSKILASMTRSGV